MNDIERAIIVAEQAIARFEGTLPALESKLLNELLNLVKQLKTGADGSISASVENLKLVSRIGNKLKNIVNSKLYVGEVAEFGKAFNKVADFQDSYFSVVGQLTKRGLLKEVKKSAMDGLVQGLMGAGLEQTLSQSIIGELKNAVLAREDYPDLVKRLQAIQSSPTNQGLLAKHSQTYARDAINDFMGQRNKIIGEDLGLKWYMYVGSNLTTTREFCEHLTKKKYVHESEIPTILSGDIDGHKCKIYDKTGLPYGLIDGTNAANFAIHRGGWNCGHQLVPVSAEAVPADVRAKIEDAAVKDNPVNDDTDIYRPYPAPTPTRPPVQPFTMDNRGEADLKNSGYSLSSDFVEKYNSSQMAGFNLPEFNSDIEKIFDDNTIRITSREISFVSGGAKLSITGETGNNGHVTLMRTFRNENGEKAVHHDYFSIPEALQGKGLSKKVFKALYKQYRNAGVTKMDVFANINVGGYTWARYGFAASQADVRRILTMGKITPDDKIAAQSIVDDFFKVNAQNTLFPMNLLTGKTWSEKLLKGNYWDGFLDLKNETQRDVFENYINW